MHAARNALFSSSLPQQIWRGRDAAPQKRRKRRQKNRAGTTSSTVVGGDGEVTGSSTAKAARPLPRRIRASLAPEEGGQLRHGRGRRRRSHTPPVYRAQKDRVNVAYGDRECFVDTAAVTHMFPKTWRFHRQLTGANGDKNTNSPPRSSRSVLAVDPALKDPR